MIRVGSTLDPANPRYLALWHTSALAKWTDAAEAFAREYPPVPYYVDWDGCRGLGGKRFRLGFSRAGRLYIVTGEPFDWSIDVERDRKTLWRREYEWKALVRGEAIA